MDFQCVFWNGRTEKHQTSTARFRLAEENGQHRPFPSLACVLPHPLQNRVPRDAGRRWRPSSADRAGRRDQVLPFSLTFRIRLHPSTTVLILSSTQNAPGFAFFGLFRVRFRIFRRFVGAKFSDWFLCILPYSDHRLKPSVIPCRREVSFLT